jgi:DDE domain
MRRCKASPGVQPGSTLRLACAPSQAQRGPGFLPPTLLAGEFDAARRDRATALPAVDHSCVRSLVCRLPAEPEQPRRDDGWTGVRVDHATVHRWALKLLFALAAVFLRRKLPVDLPRRVDETYASVRGLWKCQCRAVDKLGQTEDFLLSVHRDEAAARRLFERAIDRHDVPASITIDNSGANTPAVRSQVADSGSPRTAPIEGPEHHPRAGSPGHQEANAADEGIQVVRVGRPGHRRHRDDAHGPEGTARLPGRLGPFAGRLLLPPGRRVDFRLAPHVQGLPPFWRKSLSNGLLVGMELAAAPLSSRDSASPNGSVGARGALDVKLGPASVGIEPTCGAAPLPLPLTAQPGARCL